MQIRAEPKHRDNAGDIAQTLMSAPTFSQF